MNVWQSLPADEEAEYRQWANDNYTPGDKMDPLWHPVVRDECASMNRFMQDNYTPKMVTVETVQREAKAFMEMVSEMRGAQRQYFETRDVSVLKLSKALEKQVDKAIDKQLKDDNQQNLFK